MITEIRLPWGKEGEEGSQFFSEDMRDFKYRFDPIRYNDDMMREAAKNVMNSGRYRSQAVDCRFSYRIFSHNCQDFCDTVLEEYFRLLEKWINENPEEMMKRYLLPPEIPEIRPPTPVPRWIIR